MTISEKSAYLKGLMEGMNLNTESNEGKMIAAIVDLLGDMAKRVTDIEETTIAISDELDEIEEDLDAIEDFIMDEEDDEDWDDYEDWDDEDELDEGFDYGDEDSTIYEVVCACGEVINFDEETLEKGSMTCPNCGETLEFSFDDEEDEDLHVHFFCERCHKIYCLHDTPVPAIELPAGFTRTSCNYVVKGICEDCNRRARQAR